MKELDELRLNCIKLHDIGKKLHLKYGTDSYELRCELFDVRKDLESLKLSIKEQHKKDVVEVSQNYVKEFKLWDSRNTKTLQKQIGTDLEEFTKGRIDALRSVVSFIEQYYKDNF